MQEQQQPPRQDISFHAQWNERFDFNQWEQALPGFETADLSNIMHLNEQVSEMHHFWKKDLAY